MAVTLQLVTKTACRAPQRMFRPSTASNCLPKDITPDECSDAESEIGVYNAACGGDVQIFATIMEMLSVGSMPDAARWTRSAARYNG